MFLLFPKKNIILIQFIFAIVIVLATLVSKGFVFGISVSMGCIVALLPCIVFHLVFFVNSGMVSPNKITKKSHWAALFKFLSLIGLFVGVAQWPELDTKIFFIAFLIMQVSCWGSYLLFLRRGYLR